MIASVYILVILECKTWSTALKKKIWSSFIFSRYEPKPYLRLKEKVDDRVRPETSKQANYIIAIVDLETTLPAYHRFLKVNHDYHDAWQSLFPHVGTWLKLKISEFYVGLEVYALFTLCIQFFKKILMHIRSSTRKIHTSCLDRLALCYTSESKVYITV